MDVEADIVEVETCSEDEDSFEEEEEEEFEMTDLVLETVVEMVARASPVREWDALCRVSRRWRSVATPVLRRVFRALAPRFDVPSPSPSPSSRQRALGEERGGRCIAFEDGDTTATLVQKPTTADGAAAYVWAFLPPTPLSALAEFGAAVRFVLSSTSGVYVGVFLTSSPSSSEENSGDDGNDGDCLNGSSELRWDPAEGNAGLPRGAVACVLGAYSGDAIVNSATEDRATTPLGFVLELAPAHIDVRCTRSGTVRFAVAGVPWGAVDLNERSNNLLLEQQQLLLLRFAVGIASHGTSATVVSAAETTTETAAALLSLRELCAVVCARRWDVAGINAQRGLTADARRWLLSRLCEWRLLRAAHVETLLLLSDESAGDGCGGFDVDASRCVWLDAAALGAGAGPLPISSLALPLDWPPAASARVVLRCTAAEMPSLAALSVSIGGDGDGSGRSELLSAIGAVGAALRRLALHGTATKRAAGVAVCALLRAVGSTLAAVDLRDCPCVCAAPDALSDALGQCNALRSLGLPPTAGIPARLPATLAEIACGCDGARLPPVVGALRPVGSALAAVSLAGAADDAFVASLAELCPRLAALTVADACGLRGTCLVALSRCCPVLERLALRRASALEDRTMRAWAEEAAAGSNEMRELCIAGALRVSGETVGAVVSAVGRSLRVLDIAGAFLVDDSALCSVGAHCPWLESLDATMCGRVTDAGVAAVAAGCPRLREIALYNCTLVGERGVAALAERCVRGRADFVGAMLYGLRGLTENAVIALAHAAPGLLSLDLSSCPAAATDDALVAIARGCPRLERLLLVGDAAAGDRGLCEVARRCVFLRHVLINGCVRVTDAFLHELARHALCLESLSAVGCERLGESGGLEVLAAATHCTLAKVRLSSTCAVDEQVVARLRARSSVLSLVMV